jgi:hypothetical protein
MLIKGWLILTLGISPTWAQAQHQSAVHSGPLLAQISTIAADFENRVHAAGFPTNMPKPNLFVDTIPQLSLYTRKDNTVHTGSWEDLKPDTQALFIRWAGYAGDTSGRQLFDDMFHRFFLTHELAHWLQFQTPNPENVTNFYQRELSANRISIAYWRGKDPAYLLLLVARFRRIRGHLPDPVPSDQNAQQYFNANYSQLGSNAGVYGWYQLGLVISAFDERPSPTFVEILRQISEGRNR